MEVGKSISRNLGLVDENRVQNGLESGLLKGYWLQTKKATNIKVGECRQTLGCFVEFVLVFVNRRKS